VAGIHSPQARLTFMNLVPPAEDFKESFIEAVKELQSETDTMTTRRYRELSIPELEADFESFVEKERSHAEGKNQPDGYVPQSEFWLVDNGEYIGHVGIRHELTEHLKTIGGHIGYSIRPSKRGKGYGNKILELVLPKSKALGIDRVLLTCDATNVASRKVIEKNGGILENQVHNPETGVDKLRFWIDVASDQI
jgi:predicted acetyltransferase